MVLEEFINEDLLELEQEHNGEEEAGKKETAGEEKEEPQENFTVKCSAEALAASTNSLKSLNTWTPTQKSFH